MTRRRAPDEDVAALVDAVRRSAKYRHIAPDLVAEVGARELRHRDSLGEAIKETKSALHQVAGAYLDSGMHYDTWLGELRAADERGGPEAVREACRTIMRHHASTRERLGILDTFYRTTLAEIPPPRSIVDVACGLNPLALPWMPHATGATYQALDIYDDMIAFLDAALPLLGVQGQAAVCDVSRTAITAGADLALVLKVLPLLDHLHKGAGLRLLQTLAVPYILVSFPVRSLGGRERGMLRAYEERFAALVASEGWTARRFVFASELAFLVETHRAAGPR